MGRGLMGWGDLTARRRDFAPGLGSCQRLCGLLLDSKRPTLHLQSLLLSVRPHLAAFSHRLRQRPVAARTQRKDCSTPWCGVAGFAIECGQGEVHGGCAAAEGAERHKGHSSLRQP